MMHSCSTVAERSRHPWPTVTYLPMTVAAERPVGDVLHEEHTQIDLSAGRTVSGEKFLPSDYNRNLRRTDAESQKI